MFPSIVYPKGPRRWLNNLRYPLPSSGEWTTDQLLRQIQRKLRELRGTSDARFARLSTWEAQRFFTYYDEVMALRDDVIESVLHGARVGRSDHVERWLELRSQVSNLID